VATSTSTSRPLWPPRERLASCCRPGGRLLPRADGPGGCIAEQLPFDVLLGSVQWIGACLFDALEWATAQEQWSAPGGGTGLGRLHTLRRGASSIWCRGRPGGPDLAKVAGHRPEVSDEFCDRIAEAARSSGLAAELNSSIFHSGA
jgi:hypothetical protein